MSRLVTRLALAFGLLAAPLSWSQPFAWKWQQPWTPPRASQESRVISCTNPTPLTRIAMDDWICQQSGPIVRYCWWGTVSTPAQRFRPYYIAIYRNLPGGCQPDLSATGRLYQTCIVPDYAAYVGTDCQQRRVFRMSGVTPAAASFIQLTGQHYWLQISEADAESVQPNVENFRWSAHRPIVNCNAVQFSPPVGIIQPLIDPCDQQEEDLAFCLARKDISGTINPPGGLLPPPILHLNLLDTAGVLREQLCVEPDDQGNFYVIPESPDGTYIAELSGGGLLRSRQSVQIQDGQCARLSFFDIFYGDLDNNGAIELNDLALMLSNFGRMVMP